MKNLLEKIIKTVLIEQTGVGKIQRIALSQAEMQDAKASGAVFAYKVITRNAKTERARLDLVRAATMASVNVRDDRTAVGAESKFADGKYVYVIDPAVGDGRRQVSLVRIFPELKSKSTTDSDTEDPNVINVQTIVNYIGRSRIMSLQGWQSEQKLKGQTTTTSMKTDANVLDRVATAAGDAAEKVIDKVTGKPEETPTSTTTQKTKTPQDGYPFDWTGKDGNWPWYQDGKYGKGAFKVYTMAPTDPYVYIKHPLSLYNPEAGHTWHYLNKKDFEANYTDPSKIYKMLKSLNDAGIKNIETKFGLSASAVNQNQTQDQTQNRDQDNLDPDTQDQNQSVALKAGSTVQFKEKVGTKIPVYQWFNKEKRFRQVNTYTIEKDLKDLTFEKKSQDNKYVLIKWPAGQKYWIAARHLKQLDQIQGHVTQVGDKVNGLQVTVDGKTRAPKKGDIIAVPSSKLYNYNADTKKFYATTKTWTDNGKKKMFVTQSADKQWVYVNFGGGDKYWVPASIFKK